MIYTTEKYKTLADRFNSNSFLGKLIIIKNNPDLFTIESDGYNIRLRLEDEAQKQELDLLFSFPETFGFEEIKDVFSLVDIKVKALP